MHWFTGFMISCGCAAVNIPGVLAGESANIISASFCGFLALGQLVMAVKSLNQR